MQNTVSCPPVSFFSHRKLTFITEYFCFAFKNGTWYIWGSATNSHPTLYQIQFEKNQCFLEIRKLSVTIFELYFLGVLGEIR